MISRLLWWIMIPVLCTGYNLPKVPFYFPVEDSGYLCTKKSLLGRHIYDTPLVVYRNPLTGVVVVHSDICPHMGALLHNGWIGDNGGLHCPYHGFEFNQDGMFCNIPNPVRQYKRHESRVCLPAFPVLEKHNYLFIPGMWPSTDIYHPFHDNDLVWPKTNIDSHSKITLNVPYSPYFPPEQDDPAFRVIHGKREIDQFQDVVTENLLDMLHISYVHSFGNPLAPIPYDVRGEAIHDWGYRTRFMYTPNKDTISTSVGKVSCVIVENEVYMPSTTITRVIAGNIVKTVHTMTTPRDGKKCTLYWRIYRNFWRDPCFPTFDSMGDSLLRFFMEKTIDEDQDILNKIDIEHRYGMLTTKYDMTIRKYREFIQKFTE